MDKSSYADQSASIGRLDLYLLSNGSQLPKDWEKYKKTPDICLFCNVSAATHPVMKYDVAGTKSSGKATGTSSCHKCTAHIRQMEDTIPGTEDGVPTDLYDVEAIIDAYVFHGSLPRDWHQYMLHNKDAVKRHKCFFCDGGIDVARPNELTLPVTHSQYLTGGRVHVCSSCLHMYMSMTNGLSVVKDSCYQCETNYPIDDLEHTYRQYEKTMSKHSCPDCTKVLVVDLDKVIPTDEGYLRNNLCQCHFCKNEVMVDSTIDPTIIQGRRGVGKGIVCDSCLLEEDFADSYAILSRKPTAIKITEEYVIHVYNLNAKKKLLRKVLTNGAGTAYSPVDKEKIINILLKNGREEI